MQVELSDGLKGGMKIPASRVVVYDDFGNPLALAVKVEGQRYVVSTVTQKNFHKLLKALGVDKTVIVDRLNSKNLKILDT